MSHDVWYPDYFPIGMMISGETLKELVEKKTFRVSFAQFNHACFEPDFSTVADDETWIIGLNTNSNTVQFVQIFTADRVVIETHSRPEIKQRPLFDFNNAF
jgi:hypothetical protein